MPTPHLQDDELVLHYYGEMPAAEEHDAGVHLSSCEACQVNYAKLQRVMVNKFAFGGINTSLVVQAV